jgi:hypothetical protein
MSIHSIGEFYPVPERPGMRTRKLIATEHGFTSFFVGEFEMDQGASVPLHTHPIEEALVVIDGAVTGSTWRRKYHSDSRFSGSDSAGSAARASKSGNRLGTCARRSRMESSRFLPRGYNLSRGRSTERLNVVRVCAL